MRYLAAALLTVCLVAAAPAPAAVRCPSRHAKTLVATAAGRVVATYGHFDGEYGSPTTLHFCRPGGRQVRREHFASTDAIEVADGTSAGHYLAFALTDLDVACSKYDGGDCVSARVSSYDMRTGRRRSRAFSASDALVVTTNGWLAWVTASQLLARVDGATRTLDAGPVDADSLAASGTSVSWKRGGQPKSADLG